jgi:hypothetical protein
MEELKHDTKFRFVFAGGGPLRRSLEDRCRKSDLRQVDFKSYSRRARPRRKSRLWPRRIGNPARVVSRLGRSQ